MKRWSMITAVICMVTLCGIGSAQAQELLNYEVLSIDANSWVVTAKDTASGEVVSFRLPPSTFKGKTFDADLANVKPGRNFAVRGPRNERLNNLVMQRTPSRGEDPMKMRPRKRMMQMAGGAQLGWVIEDVGQNWVVKARNKKNGKTMKFKVDPNSFKGFRFRANLKGIKKGEGFSIYAPNERSFSRACTLMELKQ